jgi:hypothetical protein
MGSRLFKNGLRVGVLDAGIYGPSIPRMLGITAAAARSFRMAAAAWKPNGPSPSRQPARAGFCPVAARIWDKSPAKPLIAARHRALSPNR